VDIHLGPGPNTEGLVDAWARGAGPGGMEGVRALLGRWTEAVRRSLRERPPRTKPGWDNQSWAELAGAFAPAAAKAKEKRFLRELLLFGEDHRLGALPLLWDLQSGFDDDELREEVLHDRLEKREPSYGQLLTAIRSYESFARSLQDGFDVLTAEAARPDAQGFAVPEAGLVEDFRTSVAGLHSRFETAHHALSEITLPKVSLSNLFVNRFQAFAEPMDAGACALAMCEHHETVQRAKSVDGKRAWFDRLGGDRIFIRHAYRKQRQPIEPDRYLHDYRGLPIRRFWRDLS
jgi:hypothetical protein